MRYTVLVLVLAAAFLLFPILLDAILPERETTSPGQAELYDKSLLSFGDWPLTFEALDGCTPPSGIGAPGSVEFDCGDVKATVIGMAGVDDPVHAVERSIRALDPMGWRGVKPEDFSHTVGEIKPHLMDDIGAERVYLTDYSAADLGGSTDQLPQEGPGNFNVSVVGSGASGLGVAGLGRAEMGGRAWAAVQRHPEGGQSARVAEVASSEKDSRMVSFVDEGSGEPGSGTVVSVQVSGPDARGVENFIYELIGGAQGKPQ